MTEEIIKKNNLIPPGAAWRWIMIGFLMVVGLAVRFYHITDPFPTGRPYRSALLARSYYYNSLDSPSDWQQEQARAHIENIGILEPPIMEHLAAAGYRLAGGEHLWIPRALASLFWVIGAIFVYLLAENLLSRDGAVFAAAFYLLQPFGVILSRSFQPDALMIMLMLISLYLIARYYKQPSTGRLVGAAIAASASLFVKPTSLFVIYTVFGILALKHYGFRRTLLKLDTWLFVLIGLLPMAIYVINGIFIDDYLRNQAQSQFLPQLLFTKSFWSGWFQMIGNSIGYLPFIGALLAFLIFPGKESRLFIASMWAGYILFGLVNTYHIHTHSYYHLQLIPIVALTLASIADMLGKRLAEVIHLPLSRMVLISALLAIMAVLQMIEIRDVEIDPDIYETPLEVSKHLDHSSHVLAIAPHYSYSLFYYGNLAGNYWPGHSDFSAEKLQGEPALSVEERFDPTAEYFVVIDFYEFNWQTDLQAYLYDHYPVLVETEDYLIFDLRHD